MHRSKFIKAIKNFSPWEINAFSDLVHSPFFNKNKKIRKLWDILGEQIKVGDIQAFDKEKVYRKIYPKDAYDELRINNLLSDLYKLLEQYLTLKQLDQSNPIKNSLLLKQLNERKLTKHFKQTLGKARDGIEKSGHQNAESFYAEYLFSGEADDFFIGQAKRSQDDNLQRKVNNLDLFYFTSKLKDACEMLNRQQIIKANYDFHFLEEMLEYLEKNEEQYAQYPAIFIYKRIYQTLTHPEEEEHFIQLKQLLDQHALLFPKQELRQMYDFAQNYCIRKINKGQSGFLEEIFNIYKALIANDLLYEGNFVSQPDYKNIVTVGIRLKEFKFTENFIREYKDKLAPEFAENAFIYNISMLYYGQKKYDQAISMLQDVEFTDVFYSLGARTTLLKIYYEKQEEAAFQNLTETFNTYLFRNKLISAPQKMAYKNMLRFAKKIFKLHLNRNYYSKNQYQKQFDKISTALSSAQNMANINWIREILAEVAPLQPEKAEA